MTKSNDRGKDNASWLLRRVREFRELISTKEPDTSQIQPRRDETPRRPDEWVDATLPPQPDLFADLVVDFGTSATVIATVAPSPRLRTFTCLVGAREFSSAVAIEEPLAGTGDLPVVKAIGPDALQLVKRAEGVPGNRVQLYNSLKRYIELLSRQASSEQDLLTLTHLVAAYIRMAVEPGYKQLRPEQRLHPTSHIVVSVPNNFNGAAISVVQQGVHAALAQLVDEFEGEGLPRVEEIQIVREGEAAAYCFWATRRGDRLVTDGRTIDATSWQPIAGMLPDDANALRRFAVLDIGAGTTDLTLVECDPESRKLRVVLNTGVPIGGVDVDKLLLSAVTIRPMTVWPFETSAGTKAEALKAIRERKQSHPVGGGLNGEAGFFDEMGWLSFGAQVFGQEESEHCVVLREPAGELASQRLKTLVQVSVGGLLSLLPTGPSERIDALVLTGRGSLLPEVRAEVLEWAREQGRPVLTLGGTDMQYELKRVVAFGCSLVPESQTRTRIPSGTLGRELRLEQLSGTPASMLGPQTPISGNVPEVWQITTRRTREPIQWFLTESRVGLNGFLGNVNEDRLSALGLLRVAARWRSNPLAGQASGKDSAFVTREPGNDQYHVIALERAERGQSRRWKPVGGFDEAVRHTENPLTGLPFNFGDEWHVKQAEAEHVEL
jgi:hypothetical protein